MNPIESMSAALVAHPSHKHCSRCGELKPREAFTSAPSKHDGISCYCRPCHSAYNKQWLTVAANREKANARSNERHRQNLKELNDVYVSYLLRRAGKPVTPWSIEAKRAEVQRKREKK